MKDYWKSRYDRSADRFADSPLKQVERTINGVEMEPEQLTLTIAAVCDALDLQSIDRVADLCCGNGLITRAVAARVGHITSADFSERMIAYAQTAAAGPNVRYVVADITELAPAFFDGIEKVYIRDSISCLDSQSLLRLLRTLDDAPTVDAIFIAGIPDADKLAVYYDDERKMEYHRKQKAAGTPHIGSWWSRAQIQEMVATTGFRVRLMDQDPQLVSAYYRYDCLIQRSDPNSTDKRGRA